MSAYATHAREREFGVRIALGASHRGVVWLAMRDGTIVFVAGVLVGLPVALLLAARVGDLLHAVAPFDPPTIAVTLVTLVVVVLAASIAPAWRAALFDPAQTMRTE